MKGTTDHCGKAGAVTLCPLSLSLINQFIMPPCA